MGGLSRSAYGSESEMTHGCVDHLRLSSCGAIPVAVLGRAEVRSALDHLPRDGELRLAWIEASFSCTAAWFRRAATRGQRVITPVGGVPIVGPLPYVPS